MRAIHPGEVLRDELDALGLSANRITSILNGKRAITPETALRLSKLFGTTPEFWINLQTSYDLKQEYARSWDLIDQELVVPAKA